MSQKIIKFSATWCNPCKTLAKTLEGVDLGIEIDSVDVDEDYELATKFGVRGVPTLILVEDNEYEIERIVGMTTIDNIRQTFKLK